MSDSRIRVLFFAEAVTLAHVARPASLAMALPGGEFDVHFAHNPVYRSLLGELGVEEHSLDSISPRAFGEALAQGRPLYDADVLARYVEQDLALIRQLQPDVVVGDFRLSLSVSCRVAKMPYIALNNAYWSPHVPVRFTVPDLPVTRLLGPRLAQAAFDILRPLVFARHCGPLNRVRRQYGLTHLGYDLRSIYSDADYVLFADMAELYGAAALPPGQHFIGPVSWEPQVALPEWFENISQDKPVVYVTLGSSGDASLLPAIVDAMSRLCVTAVISTAGRPVPEHLPANVFASEYLPGNRMAALASVVVCNGGSPTTQQALAAGVPVLGLASNLDQFLNMTVLQASGVGQLLRAHGASALAIEVAVDSLLQQAQYEHSANRAANQIKAYNAPTEFQRVLRMAAQGQAGLMTGVQ